MKILLADDHLLFSEGFSLILKKLFQNSFITLADNWASAKKSIQESDFDLIILDLFMSTNTSWENELSSFIEFQSGRNICIVSSSQDKENIYKAFELGAKGFIHKSANLQEIKYALERVTKGKLYFPPQMKFHFHTKSEQSFHTNLTIRQQEVLRMLAEGKGNRQIATSLNIMESTAKRHVYNICQQLQAKNRTEAVHRARQQGLIND